LQLDGSQRDTYMPLLPSMHTDQMAMMPYGWKGIRWSGDALALHHILRRFIQLRAQGLSMGDEHPTLRSFEVRHLLFIAFTWIRWCSSIV